MLVALGARLNISLVSKKNNLASVVRLTFGFTASSLVPGSRSTSNILNQKLTNKNMARAMRPYKIRCLDRCGLFCWRSMKFNKAF